MFPFKLRRKGALAGANKPSHFVSGGFSRLTISCSLVGKGQGPDRAADQDNASYSHFVHSYSAVPPLDRIRSGRMHDMGDVFGSSGGVRIV